MKEVFSFLKKYWGWIVLSLLLLAGSVMTDLQQPALMARIVDEGVGAGNVDVIWGAGLQMLALAAISGVCTVVGIYTLVKIGARFSRDLRAALFHQVNLMSAQNIDHFKISSLITRLTSDVTNVQTSFQYIGLFMVRGLILIIGSLLIVIGMNQQLALIFAVMMPILLVILTLVIRKVIPLFKKIQLRLDRLNTVLQENFSGMRVVRAYVQANFEKKRFKRANQGLFDTNLGATRIMAVAQPSIFLVMNLTTLAIVWFGGLMVSAQTIEVGKVMSFINYAAQILMAMMFASFIFMMFSRAQASAKRMAEVLNTKPDIADPKLQAVSQEITQGWPQITAGEIEFKDVSFKFDPQAPENVLTDINLKIKAGEILGILSPTGAGKTTLLDLVSRLYDATTGEVLVDQANVKDYRLKDLRSQIGVVTQQPTLFSGTIASNLQWGREAATQKEMWAALEVAQAADFIKEKQGLKTKVSRKGVNFSGGQKQRLSIARALIRQPKILILDDATSALDLATEAKLFAAIRDLSPQPTILLVAQKIASVEQADRILVLNEDGAIEAIGSHQQLSKTNAYYREICQSQNQHRVTKSKK